MIYEAVLTNPDHRVYLVADSVAEAEDRLIPILESLAVDGELPNLVSIDETTVPFNIGEPEHKAPVIDEDQDQNQDNRAVLRVNVGDQNFEPSEDQLSSVSEAFTTAAPETVA